MTFFFKKSLCLLFVYAISFIFCFLHQSSMFFCLCHEFCRGYWMSRSSVAHKCSCCISGSHSGMASHQHSPLCAVLAMLRVSLPLPCTTYLCFICYFHFPYCLHSLYKGSVGYIFDHMTAKLCFVLGANSTQSHDAVFFFFFFFASTNPLL